jgi:hypothetical protein
MPHIFQRRRHAAELVAIFPQVDAKRQRAIWLNRAFHVSTRSLRFFADASTAKVKLGALYHNCQTGSIFWLTLAKMGHPQPKTPVYCDNTIAAGIENNTIKRQRSWSMEMRYFWTCEKDAQGM